MCVMDLTSWAAGLAVVMATTMAVAQDSKKTPMKDTKPEPGPTAEAVQFKTADGVVIAADYYAPKAGKEAKAPVAILVHMYPADRKSWKPLVPHLQDAGFAVLAYDIRGNGGSTEPADKKLKEKYRNRDASLFVEAWQDAAAAKTWIKDRKECDASRIVLLGASIGCSISIDYGRRDSDVKAVVCLSPGTDFFGVDSISHIKAYGKRPILLISPEAEYQAIEKLIEASGGQAKGEKHPGGQEFHGTGMLTAPYGQEVIRHIVEFVGSAAKTQAAKRVQ